MFGASIGRAAQRIIDAIVRWLALGHINPNILTVIGVALNVGCGLLFGVGWFFAAGIALIVANLFDMLDGQVARGEGVWRHGAAVVSRAGVDAQRAAAPSAPYWGCRQAAAPAPTAEMGCEEVRRRRWTRSRVGVR